MNSMRLALIGGTFDADGGKRSGYVERLANALMARVRKAKTLDE
jgi:hypothetical protein